MSYKLSLDQKLNSLYTKRDLLEILSSLRVLRVQVIMGEVLEQLFGEVAPSSSSRAEDEDELGESSSLSGDSSDDEQVKDHDAAANSSSDSHGPLHELSSPVSQLPIKRGLSKFYQGKSQSLSSFSNLRSVGDLAKETPIKRKLKPSRSYAGGWDDEAQNNSYYGPYNKKKAVPKRGPRGSCASSIPRTTSGISYFATGKPPIPMHKNM